MREKTATRIIAAMAVFITFGVGVLTFELHRANEEIEALTEQLQEAQVSAEDCREIGDQGRD